MYPAIPQIQPIRSNNVEEINNTITQLNRVITSINMAFRMLDNNNIPSLNFLPLLTDKMTTQTTPQEGYLQSLTVASIPELEMYDGSVWQIIARQGYVSAALAALVNSNYSHSHGSVTGSTGSGSTAPAPHTHTISGDTHTHTIS
jgi:hypothetical protein